MLGSLASNTSFISRSAVRTPRIGPVGAVSPRAATSEGRSGLSQATSPRFRLHARLPLEVAPSVTPGSCNAVRLTSRQVAMKVEFDVVRYGAGAVNGACVTVTLRAPLFVVT